MTFIGSPSFFGHQKDSGSWSIYKVENFFDESCILEVPRDQKITLIHGVSNPEFHECYSFHNFSLMPSKNLDKIWIKGSKFGCYEKDQGRILTRIKGLRSMIASLQIGN